MIGFDRMWNRDDQSHLFSGFLTWQSINWRFIHQIYTTCQKSYKASSGISGLEGALKATVSMTVHDYKGVNKSKKKGAPPIFWWTFGAEQRLRLLNLGCSWLVKPLEVVYCQAPFAGEILLWYFYHSAQMQRSGYLLGEFKGLQQLQEPWCNFGGAFAKSHVAVGIRAPVRANLPQIRWGN